ncbi:MAG: copper chaperone PCu(A)C [Anaerolineae bacterium]|nr:copper chaperone PCu(A)C [Anaerolineae bacterium]
MRSLDKFTRLACIGAFALIVAGCGSPGSTSPDQATAVEHSEATSEHSEATSDHSETTTTGKASITVGAISITEAYARATVAEGHEEGTATAEAMAGMDMGGSSATAEATAEAMAGMDMGSNATAEATAAMGGMDMGGMDMGGVSAAYLTIENTGDSADTLLSAATDAAGMVEIHETIVKDDVAQMQPLPNGVEIAAHGKVELKPGGMHIMMMNLKHDLAPGTTIKLTLKFASGAEIALDVPVLAN